MSGRDAPGVAGVRSVSGAVAEASEAIRFEVLSDPAGVPRARAMLQRAEWAGRALLNVAAMGEFSSDRTIREYVDRVWSAAAIG